jgi:hypothetical protein
MGSRWVGPRQSQPKHLRRKQGRNKRGRINMQPCSLSSVWEQSSNQIWQRKRWVWRLETKSQEVIRAIGSTASDKYIYQIIIIIASLL